MTKRREQQLWDMISRIDSHEKVQIAIAFLDKQDDLDFDTYDDMMNAIAFISRELYHTA